MKKVITAFLLAAALGGSTATGFATATTAVAQSSPCTTDPSRC